MAAVLANEETLRKHIETLGVSDSVTIAVFNSEESLVVSGEISAVDSVICSVKKVGGRAVKLNVGQGLFSASYP